MWQNRRVSTPLPLPTDLAEAHALILRQREELAAAEVRASGAEVMIAHLKLIIAKLRREQYGQSSERGRQVLDQLELQLEELEAETSESAVTAEEKTAGTAVKSFTRGRPVRAPLPAHLPRDISRSIGKVTSMPAKASSSTCRASLTCADASSSWKRSSGTSPVVPCTRRSAISRIHHSRCASNAAQLVKAWPAMALRLT